MNRHGKKKSGILPKGRLFWLALLCASLLVGNRAAALTKSVILHRAVYSAMAPACGLAGYDQGSEKQDHWRQILLSVLSAPLPLTAYAGNTGTGEIPVTTDPVYDRYQSSELLYNGGSITLPGEDLNGENPSGDEPSGGGNSGAENDQTNHDSNSQPGENTDTRPGDSQHGTEQTGAPSDATVQTHLPASTTGKLYTKNQLQNFDYLVNQLYFVHSSTCVYPSQLDVDTLLSKNLTIDRQTEGAQILIHHTHGTEDFADSEDGNGKTILEVGDYLTELLESYGYTVIHDRSIYPYDTAYSEASAQVRKILSANPTIQLVIDLHRDATASQKRHVVELNGQTMAPLMFFNGMCQTPDGPIDYLSNPYLEDNLALSLQMKLIAEAYYPGLTRPNFLKAYQYNQHLLPRYTLVEAGFDTNTFEEVCRSMVPLANILDAVLSDPEAVVLAGAQ